MFKPEVESLARKLCAANGLDPDAGRVVGHWEIFEGRTASGHVASKRWVESVLPVWQSYAIEAHRFLQAVA